MYLAFTSIEVKSTTPIPNTDDGGAFLVIEDAVTAVSLFNDIPITLVAAL
jgi:hypothetical protein